MASLPDSIPLSKVAALPDIEQREHFKKIPTEKLEKWAARPKVKIQTLLAIKDELTRRFQAESPTESANEAAKRFCIAKKLDWNIELRPLYFDAGASFSKIPPFTWPTRIERYLESQQSVTHKEYCSETSSPDFDSRLITLELDRKPLLSYSERKDHLNRIAFNSLVNESGSIVSESDERALSGKVLGENVFSVPSYIPLGRVPAKPTRHLIQNEELVAFALRVCESNGLSLSSGSVIGGGESLFLRLDDKRFSFEGFSLFGCVLDNRTGEHGLKVGAGAELDGLEIRFSETPFVLFRHTQRVALKLSEFSAQSMSLQKALEDRQKEAEFLLSRPFNYPLAKSVFKSLFSIDLDNWKRHERWDAPIQILADGYLSALERMKASNDPNRLELVKIIARLVFNSSASYDEKMDFASGKEHQITYVKGPLVSKAWSLLCDAK